MNGEDGMDCDVKDIDLAEKGRARIEWAAARRCACSG